MPSPYFELFDLICGELSQSPQFILTERNLPGTLAGDLKRATKKVALDDALVASFERFTHHFQGKESAVPFQFDVQRGVVTATDQDFIHFAADAGRIRSGGKQSKVFELAIGKRLVERLLTGKFHNVGWPRTKNKKLAEINGYLGSLGFRSDTLRGRDKDGGLDILWLPPLGTIPVRPMVCFQCKNARFSASTIKEANSSVVTASRTIHRHDFMGSHGVYMCFVVFNDYIDSGIRDMAAGLQYVPLGLSDLSRLAQNAALSEL